MAISIVAFVVRKLSDLIAKEAKLLGGVRKQVERMERELKRIQCCLKDADSKRSRGDARAENWLNELRDVAYRIDDAVDTFHVQLENCKKDRSLWDKVKKLFHKVRELPILHKFGKELADIQNLLDEISKSKNDYVIAPLQDQGGEGSDTVIMPKRRTAYQDVDETDIVGLESDKNNILNLLRPEYTARRAVITIVGAGGLGKTTLAHMVYQSAKVNFKFHIMLSVSPQFSLIDLAKNMLRELEKSEPKKELESSEPKKEEVSDIIRELKILLSSRTYLIILDDVWEVDVWDQLSAALPDKKNGSRVLITSRSIEVAQLADSQMKPYELAFLKEKESFDLFLKKALPYRELGEECPSDLCEVAHALSEKCKGLPLALIVLGSLVSFRDKTYHAWKEVLDTMNWHEKGKECMKILAMSYEDMPYHLKNCFLYLTSFPEDYKISARWLIKMWVAEELIPYDEKKKMELKAEECLQQLVHRSMVQVSSRHSIGSIKSCQIHDLLRDLAMHQAGKENFVTIFPKPQGVNYPHRVIRRASLQSLEFREFIHYYADKNIRSLSSFGPFIPSYTFLGTPLEMVNFRLLRVVEIENANINLAGLDGLIHLKYLELRNCYIIEWPSNFSWFRLKNLETLHFRQVNMSCLPSVNGRAPSRDLWTIGKLRHVRCSNRFRSFDGQSMAGLTNLQSLGWVTGKRWRKNKLPCLKNLRKLKLVNDDHVLSMYGKQRMYWDMVGHLLETLPYLQSLWISGFYIPKKIVYPRGLPNYQNLQTLYLRGKWFYHDKIEIEASLFPEHLVKLTIIDALLEQNPMPELGRLKNLRKLRLECFQTREMMICPVGFPVLETLCLYADMLPTTLTIMEGVMPKLKHLIHNYKVTINLPSELSSVQINYGN